MSDQGHDEGGEVLWEGSYGGVPVRLLVTASGAEVSEYQRYDGQGWVVYPTPHYDHLPHHLARLLHAATADRDAARACLAEHERALDEAIADHEHDEWHKNQVGDALGRTRAALQAMLTTPDAETAAKAYDVLTERPPECPFCAQARRSKP